MDKKKLDAEELFEHLPEKEDVPAIATEVAKREIEELRKEMLRWNELQDNKVVRLRQDCRIDDIKMLVSKGAFKNDIENSNRIVDG